ncbi:cytochrome P450 [Dunaliella salina]|uniref:Cytochrome P450 n=1 Tax=Dunaliella salina TaxID=3046 RepID=A0ABQ7H648_DUNSA|nr:cytochrome P450 [Dunaliella salina]|eukprot:KAF5842337.1 cytochrome P450 [Dunaliella salina]
MCPMGHGAWRVPRVPLWANEYGGVYQLNVAGPTYVISDAKLANTILTARGKGKFPKSWQVYKPSLELSFGVPSLFNDCDEGEQYITWRKLILQCFSNDNMKAIFPIFRGCAQNLVAQWQKAQPGSTAIELEDWMQRCFLDIAFEAGFGMPGTALLGTPNEFLHVAQMTPGLGCSLISKDLADHALSQVVHDALIQVDKKMMNPLLPTVYKMLPFCAGARESRASMVKFRKLFDGMLEEFRSRGPPPEDDKRMWAQVMRARHPSTGLPYPDEVISGQIATLMVAGYDTSSWTSVWALYDIARHPDIQQRIKRELADAGLLQVKGQPQARQIEWADLSLPYFNAVIKESMRMHPVGATGTLRVAPEDMELGGYSVKKGEKLWVPIITVHNSVINFTEADKFDPERWMKAEGSSKGDICPSLAPASAAATTGSASCPFSDRATQAGHAEAHTSMLPFSAGPRNCVGVNFAYATLRVVLLSVLSNFWLELDPSVGTHAEVEAQQAMALVLTSRRPLKVRLQPHAM